MNDNPPGPAAHPDQAAADDGLEELRRLLLAPEQQELDALRRRLASGLVEAQDVSQVLPAAVVLSTKRDPQLANALTPTIERALKESVQRDPTVLTDTVFPIIGPAIRKAVAEAFRKLVQTLNQTLAHSLSLRSLKWRFEAFRTGKSFAEVVLARTLIYRVEHVLLIHHETGLLLQHVHALNVTSQDPTMIAGMLTAIQDFTRDSFRSSATDKLDDFRVGELQVWIETGTHASIAAVIRGNAPLEIRARIEAARDRVHTEQAMALEAFSGDDAVFIATRPTLEECLAVQLAEGSGAPPFPKMAALIVVLLLAGLFTFLWVRHRQDAETARLHQLDLDHEAQARTDALAKAEEQAKARRDRDEAIWRAALARLKNEPGIVVTEALHEGAAYRLAGLKDPLAADPTVIFTQAGIDASRVSARWEPYFALTPALVLRRAETRLQPPPTVTLALQGETLMAKGSAPEPWIQSARRQAEAIPGVASFDSSALVNETRAALERLQAAISETVLFFSEGLALAPGDEAKPAALAKQIGELRAVARSTGARLRVKIIGQVSSEGPPQLNRTLAQNRAEAVLKLLAESGVDPAILSAIGMANREPGATPLTVEPPIRTDRSVTFRVTLETDNPTNSDR